MVAAAATGGRRWRLLLEVVAQELVEGRARGGQERARRELAEEGAVEGAEADCHFGMRWSADRGLALEREVVVRGVKRFVGG